MIQLPNGTWCLTHSTLFTSNGTLDPLETVAPDPQLACPMARFYVPETFPNITVLRLQFPAWRWNDGQYVDNERRRLVQEFLAGPLAGQLKNPVQWFYDPMAVKAFAGHQRRCCV